MEALKTLRCPRFQRKETEEVKKARELEETCHLVYIAIYNAMKQGKQSVLFSLLREHTSLLSALNAGFESGTDRARRFGSIGLKSDFLSGIEENFELIDVELLRLGGSCERAENFVILSFNEKPPAFLATPSRYCPPEVFPKNVDF